MANADAISTSLSTILDIIIGTKERVDARRRELNIKKALKDFCFLQGYRTITCGSKMEGFNFASSDLDVMAVVSDVDVVEHDSNLLSDKLTFRMIYDQQHNGSVFLEPLNHRRRCIDHCVSYRGIDVCSSANYREYMISKLSTIGEFATNGPCLSRQDNRGHSFDVCPSFKCPTWPSIANEYVYRKRTYGWPSSAVISHIVNNGCYCVPIGDRISEHSFLQWRISFAPAEMKLVHSFSPCQFKVYGLLKILNNDILKKIVDYTDRNPLLSSYHLKNIMFFMVENSPLSFWREDNLFNCFQMCLNFLIQSVEKGFLCHYFLPSNNLFHRTIHGRNRHTLLTFLYIIRHKGIGVLYACSSLQPYLVLVQEGYNLNMTLVQKELYYDNNVLRYINLDLFEVDERIMPCILTFLNNRCDFFVYAFLGCLTQMLNKKATTLLKSTREGNLDNRTMYTIRRKCRHYLLFGTNTDVSKGWLDLATYHYLIGQSRQALTMCQHVMSSIKPWTKLDREFIQKEAYIQKFCGQGIDLLSKMKRAFSNFCSFSQISMHLNEISPEIDSSTPLEIYPQPYAAFLSFLCCHQMTDAQGQHTALSNLLALQNDKLQGADSSYPWNYIIYNLIGICYEILGDHHNAVKTYLISSGHVHECASVAKMRADRICQYMHRGN